MCDGHPRVSRKNSGLKRKRKGTDKTLLGWMAAMGHSGFVKAHLALLWEVSLLLEAEIS